MHENDFEKQFRQKMDQLEFDPSDAVWAGVNREINKDKKRRLPLFWLFLFSGVLLFGGGYYFIADRNASGTAANAKHKGETDKNQEKQSASKEEIKENRRINEPVNQREAKISRNSITFLSGNPGKESAVYKSDKGAGGAGDGKERVNKMPKHYSAEEKGDVVVSETNKQIASENQQNSDRGSIDSSVAKKTNETVANEGLNADSVSGKKTAENKKQKKDSSSWKIGLSGNAGVSNMDQAPFHTAYLTAPAYANASAPPGNPNPGTTYTGSKISPGFSFGIGGFVNKHLSERVTFSAGINYRYYSTKIQTGHFVDSSSIVYYSVVQLSAVNAYYRSGDNHTYTNQYHFIELPVTMNFQINKSNRLPVIWEAGISLSYLIYSNALQFDPYSNVYFKNDQLFNKTQFGVVTAFMFGLPVHHTTLQIGPQLQYGLTGVLKSSSGISEHLIYYGLKVSFLTGKNK